MAVYAIQFTRDSVLGSTERQGSLIRDTPSTFCHHLSQDSSDALAAAISSDSNLENRTARSDAERLALFLDDLAKVRPCIRTQHRLYLIHDSVAQVGAGTRLPQIVHQFLEHEKSWLQLQTDLIRSVALLSQQLPKPSHEDVQKLKGK